MKTMQYVIDLTKPRSHRPMTGLDIEQWRAERGMEKYDAQYALGFRNSNHYNKMCLEPILPAALELLIRIYEDSPIIPGPGWPKYSLPDLFMQMYGEALDSFKGTKYETYAKVDLGTRFTKIFDRSSARQYQWLVEDTKRNDSDLNANAVMERILAKLHSLDDPKEVLERVARKVWLLRGVDLATEFPVPSLDNPPTRQKTGRKSKLALGGRKSAAEKKAAVKPALKKVVARKRKIELTPEYALTESLMPKAKAAAAKAKK